MRELYREEQFIVASSQEAYRAALESQDGLARERLAGVLANCTQSEHLKALYNIDGDDIAKQVKKRMIPGLDLGVMGVWVPHWLIVEEEGVSKTDPKIMEIWEEWKKSAGARIFCEQLSLFERDAFNGETCLEHMRSGGPEEFEEVKDYMAYLEDCLFGKLS